MCTALLISGDRLKVVSKSREGRNGGKGGWGEWYWLPTNFLKWLFSPVYITVDRHFHNRVNPIRRQ